MNSIKKYGFVAALIFVLGLCGCGVNESGNMDVQDVKEEQSYPQIAYVENVTYYGTDRLCEMVPRKAPDGVIETFVPSEIMPDAYNSANFGSEQGQIEFMFLEDKQLILHLGENWYYFEQKAE